MAGLLEDFIQQFTGGGAPQNEAVQQFHDRFTSTNENDREFNNETYHQAATEHLQQMPADEFHAAASNALSQAPPQQRADLLTGLLGALAGAGGMGALGGMQSSGGAGGIAQIARMLGLGSSDPQQMSGDDAAKVLNYARTQNPQALQQTVAEKPWFMKALGNPIGMGALTMAAAKLLNNSRRR